MKANADGASLDDTLRELEAELEEINPDLALPAAEMLAILQQGRHTLVVEYQRFRMHSRLNRLVENKALADQQDESAKKLAIQINQLDKDIAGLQSIGTV